MNRKLSIVSVVCLSTFGCLAQNNESENIKRLLEKESATWRSGDSRAHASCWYIQPYSNEESTAKDGTKSYSYEIRLLEKINTEWKLVGQSIHMYQKKE